MTYKGGFKDFLLFFVLGIFFSMIGGIVFSAVVPAKPTNDVMFSELGPFLDKMGIVLSVIGVISLIVVSTINSKKEQ